MADVVELTGLGARAIQQMAARGEIPSAAQLGRVWTFRREAVLRWIEDAEGRAARCRNISTGAARSGGSAPPLPVASIDEAYARLFAS